MWMSWARGSGEGHYTYGTITVRDAQWPTPGLSKRRLQRMPNGSRKLKADLARIEYFSKGTVLARMINCGKPKCPCGADPKKPNGPYSALTSKNQANTINFPLT